MSEDFHWRQFLLFCYRNGLYYGEQPDDKSAFMWTAENMLVHSLPENFARPLASKQAKEHHANGNNKHVLVGSLERLLRKME